MVRRPDLKALGLVFGRSEKSSYLLRASALGPQWSLQITWDQVSNIKEHQADSESDDANDLLYLDILRCPMMDGPLCGLDKWCWYTDSHHVIRVYILGRSSLQNI